MHVARDIRTIILGGGRQWVPAGDRVVNPRTARETTRFIFMCSPAGQQPRKSSAAVSKVAIQLAIQKTVVFWGVMSCSFGRHVGRFRANMSDSSSG